MHGECKTPGGKLIAVQFDIQDITIQNVRISGDFFVHPEQRTNEILQCLTAVIEKHQAGATVQQWHDRLQGALPWEVELLGSSTLALAVAICRACGQSAELELPLLAENRVHSPVELKEKLSSWKQAAWQIIPEIPLPAAMNVALDEVFCEQVAKRNRPATLRFWRWTEQAVILGRCQSVINEVDTRAAAELGIRIVRRMTGGGAMFLQPHGAITYSLYLPEELLQGIPLRASYQVCDSWVVDCLRQLGVDAFHAPLNDISCSMGKIGGAAQARRKGVVLHHTTMAYDMNAGDMVRVLRIGREKLSDKPAISSAAKRVSPLARQTGLSREVIVDKLLQYFSNQTGGVIASISAEEMVAAEALVQIKYGNDGWTKEIA